MTLNKLTIMILALMLSSGLFSQGLAVSDFYLNIHDMTANQESTKVMDDNGEVCALIKVETTQKGFFFEGGTMGIVKVDESQVGEIWVYVSAGFQRITIKHPQLGILRDHYLPERLKAGYTYIMRLISGTVEPVVNQKSNQQWLVLNYEPKNATVEIDGELVAGRNGEFKKVYSHGKHDYRVSCENYHQELGKFEIGSEKSVLNIRLKPAFGWVEIKGPNGASVFIDNKNIGTAPVRSDALPSGSHNLRIVKENWKSYSETVIVNDSAVTTVNPQLIANFVTVKLSTGGNAEIWVNDIKRGNGSVTIDLSPGEYTFETRKECHRSQSIVREITLSSGGTIDLPAPVAIVGSLSIDVNPTGAKIYIDGEYKGDSPLLIDNILAGKHKVKCVYSGLMYEERTVEISEGKICEISVTMNRVNKASELPEVTIYNGKLLQVDKHFSGEFIIDEEIQHIGLNAFYGCTGITRIIIPDNMRKIDTLAFRGCSGLTSITLPKSINRICFGAFYGCASLTNVKIPASVILIEKSAFYECRALTSVTIPNSVKSIGEMAFANCMSLASVTILNGETSIDINAFSGCNSLSAIYVPKGSKKRFEKIFPKELRKLIREK